MWVIFKFPSWNLLWLEQPVRSDCWTTTTNQAVGIICHAMKGVQRRSFVPCTRSIVFGSLCLFFSCRDVSMLVYTCLLFSLTLCAWQQSLGERFSQMRLNSILNRVSKPSSRHSHGLTDWLTDWRVANCNKINNYPQLDLESFSSMLEVGKII